MKTIFSFGQIFVNILFEQKLIQKNAESSA